VTRVNGPLPADQILSLSILGASVSRAASFDAPGVGLGPVPSVKRRLPRLNAS
jgi:hypothetical protein